MAPISKSQSLIVQAGDPGGPQQQRRRKVHRIAERSAGLLNRVLAGLVVMLVLIGGLGGWSATAKLSSAVIVPGQIVVDGSAKKVQHPTGGVISGIKVKNGDRVGGGDVLLTLDETQAGAQLAILENRLVRLATLRARFEAERDGRNVVAFPEDLDQHNPRTKSAIAGAQDLLTARMKGWRSQKARLGERIDQYRKEIEAIHAQRHAKEREIELIRKELAMVEDLRRKNLTNVVRLIGMQREVARYEGEHGALMAQVARVESQIKEIELQIVELDQRLLTEAQSEIGHIESQISELEERKLAAVDQVKRTELRAPVAGVVHDLGVHTIGGVLKAGETAMLIIPDTGALTVEVRVAPSDIDQVSIGQSARLRFSALNQRTTPELNGTVTHLGVDLSRDALTGREYYIARIGLVSDQSQKLGNAKLVSGMPVEGFIATGERTALSYLLKPIQDHLERAMKEE